MSKGDILVVDDTVANLDVVAQVLEDEGYEVAIAINGERAIKAVGTHAPDLILLDVQMPGMDGFEVCRQLKADPKTAAIPVIFMTALSDTASKVKGFDLGAVDYIPKPFEAQELLARVRTHTHLRQLNLELESRVSQRTQTLEETLENLKSTQRELIQREKMSALGNLVAGIAHEINNPLGFLSGSVKNEQDYLKDILHHLSLYQQQYPQPTVAIREDAEEIDLEFICEDSLKVLSTMKDATSRIKQISNSLRTFARADTERKVEADIHDGVDSTLRLLAYRLKGNKHRPAITVIKDYSDELSFIQCFPGQLHQVFMNLIANAIDAFDEAALQTSFAALEDSSQNIWISTVCLPHENAVEIRVRDNGKGMSAAVKDRVFEHLFTTKAVGKGTGLGLAIARQIIVEAHGGDLSVQSEPEQGTEFLIRLPTAL